MKRAKAKRPDVVRGVVKIGVLDAEIWDGILAVHPSYARKGYTVSHVRTGYACMEGIRTEESARRLCRRLLPLNWNFSSVKRIPEETKAGAKKILNAYLRAAK